MRFCALCAQLLSCTHCFVTPWTAAHQAPLSVEFSRQEYWNGLPFLSLEIFLTQGWNPHLESLASAGRFFTTSTAWEAQEILVSHYFLLSNVQISFCHKYFSDHTSQLWILSLLNFQHIFSFHFGMWQTRGITEWTWINGTVSQYGGFFRLLRKETMV